MAITPTAPNPFSLLSPTSCKKPRKSLRELMKRHVSQECAIWELPSAHPHSSTGTSLRRPVQAWVAEIKSLSAIAKTQPQAAFAVFVHAMKLKWTFLARTMQEASGLFTELEQAIDNFLIPAMTDCPPVSKEERQILSLQCRNGGLGLINPAQIHHHYQDSSHLTGPLADNIVAQDDSLGAATTVCAVRKRETRLTTRAME